MLPSVTGSPGVPTYAQARWFDQLDRGTLATSLFDFESWRSQWSLPAAGRSLTISRLAAATGEPEEAAGALKMEDGGAGDTVGGGGDATDKLVKTES